MENLERNISKNSLLMVELNHNILMLCDFLKIPPF